MLFDLTNPGQREKFLEKVDKLIQEDAYVELKKKNQRTNSQNRYLHLIIGHFALETGYAPDYVKPAFFKKKANAEIFVEEIDGKLGKVRQLRSSADLSTEEMSKAIERFKNWSAAAAGIHLPDANEHEFLKNIEIELSRNYY